jgi:hypothetical protein
MIDYCRLGRAKSAFALATAITILFNTALACAKDAHQPLSRFMGSVAGHNWTAQGLVDLILFFGLGLGFTKAGWAERIEARRLISLVVAAVVVGSVGLVAWYALF